MSIPSSTRGHHAARSFALMLSAVHRPLLFGAALGAASMLAACHHETEAAAKDTSGVKAESDYVKIPTGAPQHQSLDVAAAVPVTKTNTHVTGRLVWDEQNTVRVFSSVAGRVRKILTMPGTHVSEGESMATLESPEFSEAQADASKSEADLKLAQRTLERQKELFEHGAAAKKDVEAAEDDLATKVADHERATSRMKMYGVTGNAVDGLFPLKAPLGGIVVERNLNPGQEVRPDQMLANDPRFVQPLFTISDPTKLTVVLDVNETETPALKPGQPLHVRVQAYPQREFTGKLDFIGDSIDPLTRTVKVRGTVANAEGLLKAEMFVSVDVETTGAVTRPVADAAPLDVPGSAVFLKNENHFVFVETEPGTYRRKPVKVDAQQDGHMLVTEGLAAGQMVVTRGVLLLDAMTDGVGGGAE